MSQLAKQNQLGSPRIRVLLADGTQVSDNQFAETLQNLHFVRVVGLAKTSDKALDLFFQLQPDVAVVSIILPKLDGMEVLRCIKRAAPNCDVILLSHAPNGFLEQAASLLGASGLCSIHEGVEELRRLLFWCYHRKFGGNPQARAGHNHA